MKTNSTLAPDLSPAPADSNVIAILYGNVQPDANEDERNVLSEVESVLSAIKANGYDGVPVSVSLNFYELADTLRVIQPACVFNLVESLDGFDRFIHFIPTMLDNLQIPYTGVPTEALFLTTNKLVAKKIMVKNDLPTPPFASGMDVARKGTTLTAPYIVKSIWDHASISVTENALVPSSSALLKKINRIEPALLQSLLVEEFIDGREFNISLFDGDFGPVIFPPAEIIFDKTYFANKPRIVDYNAKWNEKHPACAGTPRSFKFGQKDKPLLDKLKSLSKKCWEIFDLHGYARVDFRVDKQNNPFILEINANPCISVDSGFVAAAAEAGLSYNDLIKKIIACAFARLTVQPALFS